MAKKMRKMNKSKRAILGGGGVYLRGAVIGVLGYAQKHEKIVSVAI